MQVLPAEQVAPELIGCLLVKRQGDVSCCGKWGTPLRQDSDIEHGATH